MTLLRHRFSALKPVFANIFIYIIFLFIAINFSLNLQKSATIFLDINEFISGEAKLPYQYRSLLAGCFDYLIQIFSNSPQRLKVLLANIQSLSPSRPEEVTAYIIVNTISFWLSLIFFSKIAKRFFLDKASRFAALSIFIISVYFTFILNPDLSFILPYDLPSLAFNQAMILLILLNKKIMLVAIFILATLNRETSFLIPLFLVIRLILGIEKKNSTYFVALLIAIFLITKTILFTRYLGNESEQGFRITMNFYSMAKPWHWPTIMPLIAMVYLGWRSLKVRGDSRQWGITFLVGFILIFSVGLIIETRAFGDLLGFAAISATIGLGDLGLIARNSKV